MKFYRNNMIYAKIMGIIIVILYIATNYSEFLLADIKISELRGQELIYFLLNRFSFCFIILTPYFAKIKRPKDAIGILVIPILLPILGYILKFENNIIVVDILIIGLGIFSFIITRKYLVDLTRYPNKYLIADLNKDIVTINYTEYKLIDIINDTNKKTLKLILKDKDSAHVFEYLEKSDSFYILKEDEGIKIIDEYKKNLPNRSVYKGSLLGTFFINIVVFLGSLLTLGIAFPYFICLKLRYKTSRTYINGEKLVFTGRGINLFFKFLGWMLLTIITFGIYSIWLIKKVKQWTTKHTHFAVYSDGESAFNAPSLEYFFLLIGLKLVTILTIGILSFWAHCTQQRYESKHTIIDGFEITFDGTAFEYFVARIVWLILSIITLGIYSLWLVLNTTKWNALHTKLLDENDKEIIRNLF